MGQPGPFGIDRAGADDVLQLAVDRGRVPMAIGALLVLNPRERPPADQVRTLLVQRAGRVPRLGQRLMRTPPGAGRPVWVDAGARAVAERVDELVVDLDPAVPRGAHGLDDVGGPGESVPRALLDATAELVTTRLDPCRPLWRARLLLDDEGLVAGVAVAAHHALADGMGGLTVLGTLTDGAGDLGDGGPAPDGGDGGRTRDPVGRPSTGVFRTTPSDPAEEPGWRVLARDAWEARLRAVRSAPRSARRMVSGAGELGLRRPRLADRCTLLGRTGSRRRLEVATTDLAGLKAASHARGASINDLVVTAVTGALVELLSRRGERVHDLVVSVPVSRRVQEDAGSLGNATGVVPVRVPATADTAARVAALVAEHGRMRAPARGGSAAVLTPAFRALASMGVFQLFVDHQRLVHTFVTNVRGPAGRLAIAGAEVEAVVPVAVNPGNVAVSFDVLSYAGTLSVTLVCDPLLVPESAWLADRVAAGLADLY